MKKIILSLTFLFFINNLISQDWIEKANKPDANLYEIQKEFYKYFSDKDITIKSTGYKAFKRWEHFVKPRVYPSGNLSVLSQTSKNYADFLVKNNINPNGGANKFSNTNSVQSTTWVPVGPMGAPSGLVFGLPRKAGRDNFVTFHPTNPLIIFAGSAGGGLWKTTDGGTTWAVITDNLPVQAVSDLAIDPTNPNIMYMGTGGGDDILSAYPVGSDGLYKTIDGGNTWTLTGLTFSVSLTRVIHKVIIDPSNTSIVMVATNVGIYRSTNGGTSFTVVNGLNCWDLKFKIGNSSVVYATGTTFYKSTNNGVTFAAATLTTVSASNRMQIALTPNNPSCVYVLASRSSDSQFLGVYQSTDDGVTFTTKSTTPNIIGNSCAGNSTGTGQGWYDLAIAASPTNSNEVVVGGVNVWRSIDGAANWSVIGCWNSPSPYIHADIHELEYTTSGTLFSTNDGGIYTYNGSVWNDITGQRNIAQIYKIGLSSLTPNVWITGHQDNGSNIKNGANYIASLSGDGMDCFIDRTNDNTMFAEQYNGSFNRSTNGGANWTAITTGLTGTGDWVTPWKQDPIAANVLYAGRNTMFKSTNLGTSWTQLGNTGGGGSIIEFAIAPSNNQVIYVLHPTAIRKTVDGGITWTNITQNVSGGTLSFVTIDPNDPNTAWVTVSGYSAGNKVFQTLDGGATWMNISSNLPNLPANCSVYEPGSNDRIYIGMDVGIYYKDNSSSTWTLYNAGLPNVAIMDMEMTPAAPGKIYAATYGRGVYEADVVPVTAAPVTNFTYYGSICVGQPKTFVDNSSNTPNSWSWTITPTSGVTFNTLSSQNPTVTFANPGVYSISHIVGNSFGSGAVYTQTMSVYTLPSLTLSINSLTVCDQDPFTLNASGATTYTWSYSGGFNSSATYIPNGDMTYTVTGSNFGCIAKDTVHVTNLPKPNVVLSVNSLTVCAGVAFTASVSGAVDYVWSNGGGIGSTATYSTNSNFTYTVTGYDSGCSKTDTLRVEVIACVGIVELKQNGTSFSVYPNPASDRITLKMNTVKNMAVTIELFNNEGKLVLKQTADFAKDKTEFKVNIASIANGIYYLKVNGKEGASQSLKIVKE